MLTPKGLGYTEASCGVGPRMLSRSSGYEFHNSTGFQRELVDAPTRSSRYEKSPNHVPTRYPSQPCLDLFLWCLCCKRE